MGSAQTSFEWFDALVATAELFGMAPVINLAGRAYGRWTVVRYAGNKKWLVKCDCGTEKEIHGSTLRNGQSMGCSDCSVGRTTHGMHGTTVYACWSNMIGRCHNPKREDFKFYGARGISVCAEWRKDFAEFYAHVGEPPVGFWLDRHPNNDGNYEPGNVRWASPSGQARNTRRNIWINFAGAKRTLIEVSELTGIDYDCLRRRFHSGWTDADMVIPESRPSRSLEVA
jgi:hypothetical protein